MANLEWQARAPAPPDDLLAAAKQVKLAQQLAMCSSLRDMTLPQSLQEGDPEEWWKESFKNFLDSKPKGPQAISLDIAFPGAQHVYGIPEHARSLSLPPTKGYILHTTRSYS